MPALAVAGCAGDSSAIPGDYESVAVEKNRAYTLMTDARNGRSSGGPAGGATFPSQPGRNPACEQSDVFFDSWGSDQDAHGQSKASKDDALFLVTPCPTDAESSGGDDDD